MQPHVVSLITMVIQSQTFVFYTPWDGVEPAGLTFKQPAGLSQLGGTKSVNSE